MFCIFESISWEKCWVGLWYRYRAQVDALSHRSIDYRNVLYMLMHELQFTLPANESDCILAISCSKMKNSINFIWRKLFSHRMNELDMISTKNLIAMQFNTFHSKWTWTKFENTSNPICTYNRNISLNEWHLNGIVLLAQFENRVMLECVCCPSHNWKVLSWSGQWMYLPVAVSIVTKEQFHATYCISFWLFTNHHS